MRMRYALLTLLIAASVGFVLGGIPGAGIAVLILYGAGSAIAAGALVWMGISGRTRASMSAQAEAPHESTL